MPASLLFPDPHSARDVLTFAGRAAPLSDGALRLRARAGTLAMSAAALAPAQLGEQTPTILGMRFVAIDPELECDLTISASSLTADPERPEALLLPDAAVSAPWAGVSPPRSGWSSARTVPASVVAARAQWGMAAVAHQVPAAAGEEIVHRVRAEVWGQPDADLADLPRGVAFAASTLGFVQGEEDAMIRHSGVWTRLSLSRGHVLVRSGVPQGLTPVRRTGS